MNSINQNIRNRQYLQNTFKAEPSAVSEQTEVQLPDKYKIPQDTYEPKGIKDVIKQVDIMNMVSPWFEHPVLMAGTSAGIIYGLDKFTKACGGSEYEKSLTGRVGRFGDRIHNSKLFQNDFSKKIGNSLSTAKTKLNNILGKSDVITAIRTTPSQPEWSMVKDELSTQEQRVAHEFFEITNKLGLTDVSTGNNPANFIPGSKTSGELTLDKLALTKEEKTLVKSIANKQEAVNTVLLKRLGRTEAEIQHIIGLGDKAGEQVKAEILKEMGITADDLKKFSEDSAGNISKIKAAAERAKGKVWVGAGNYKLLGPFQVFERKVGCDEVFNRLHSLSDGAATNTGRNMSRFLQKCHRGFSMGGGKLGVLFMVAHPIVQSLVDAKKAEPNEKIGTIANGVIGATTWVFTFPLGIKLMHAVGGMQYAGMGKDKVNEYRKLLNEFNTKVKGKVFTDKASYDAERTVLEGKLKALKEVKGQNLITKACRKLGRFLTMDLERIKSFRSGTAAGNTARRIPSFLRNLGGVPMRLIMWGCITMGCLEPLIEKGVKKIFGKHYDSSKEEDNKALKKQQKAFLKADLQERMMEAQKKKLAAAQSPQETPIEQEQQAMSAPSVSLGQTPQTETPQAETNHELNPTQSLPMTKPQEVAQEAPMVQEQQTEPTPQSTYIPSQKSTIENPNQTIKPVKHDTYTYIPSQDSTLEKPAEAKTRKYIPAQTPANIVKNFDNSGLNGALRRADLAETKALELLSGKFHE